MQLCPPDGFANAIVSARTLLHNTDVSARTLLNNADVSAPVQNRPCSKLTALGHALVDGTRSTFFLQAKCMP